VRFSTAGIHAAADFSKRDPPAAFPPKNLRFSSLPPIPESPLPLSLLSVSLSTMALEIRAPRSPLAGQRMSQPFITCPGPPSSSSVCLAARPARLPCFIPFLPMCCARGERQRGGSLFSPFSCVLCEGRGREGVDVLDFIWFLYYVFFKANFHYFDNHMVCSYEYLKWEWLNILFCL
jgi:hypothetical protein